MRSTAHLRRRVIIGAATAAAAVAATLVVTGEPASALPDCHNLEQRLDSAVDSWTEWDGNYRQAVSLGYVDMAKWAYEMRTSYANEINSVSSQMTVAHCFTGSD
jgi:hypothetical protein